MPLQVPGCERNDRQSTGTRGRERRVVRVRGGDIEKIIKKIMKQFFAALKKGFSLRLNSLMPCRAKEA